MEVGEVQYKSPTAIANYSLGAASVATLIVRALARAVGYNQQDALVKLRSHGAQQTLIRCQKLRCQKLKSTR
jgi:hypothetical protein